MFTIPKPQKVIAYPANFPTQSYSLPKWQPVKFRAIALAACIATLFGTMSHTQDADEVKGFVVDHRGYLGVGTAAPEQTLHVKGNSLTEGVLMGDGLGGDFGSAAVINGATYIPGGIMGQRSFVLEYHPPIPWVGVEESNVIVSWDPNTPDQRLYKTFIIDHPTDQDRHLVHAALEGPEGAVFYRGSAQLENGRIEISLPPYFEALTKEQDRTIQLTNIDGFDRLAIQSLDGVKITNGAFVVISEQPQSSQQFDWNVTAVRADGPPLEVEPLVGSILIGGMGPYTYQIASP